MAEMTVEKLHAIIGALYATIAVHEQTIAEQNAIIVDLRGQILDKGTAEWVEKNALESSLLE